jgi:hypothetical protein
LAALIQILIDDIAIDSIFVATTYISTGITEGNGRQTFSDFKSDFFPAVKAGWATSVILMPLEFICFRFLPLSFRVLGTNLIDIIWDGVLSYKVHENRNGVADGEEIQTPTPVVYA